MTPTEVMTSAKRFHCQCAAHAATISIFHRAIPYLLYIQLTAAGPTKEPRNRAQFRRQDMPSVVVAVATSRL